MAATPALPPSPRQSVAQQQHLINLRRLHASRYGAIQNYGGLLPAQFGGAAPDDSSAAAPSASAPSGTTRAFQRVDVTADVEFPRVVPSAYRRRASLPPASSSSPACSLAPPPPKKLSAGVAFRRRAREPTRDPPSLRDGGMVRAIGLREHPPAHSSTIGIGSLGGAAIAAKNNEGAGQRGAILLSAAPRRPSIALGQPISLLPREPLVPSVYFVLGIRYRNPISAQNPQELRGARAKRHRKLPFARHRRKRRNRGTTGRMSVILDGRFDRTNVNERTEKGSRESRGATFARGEVRGSRLP